eukprot:907277_1
MANIINDQQELTEQYESLLEYLPGHFHVTGQSKLPHIIIPEIDAEHPLQYPLSNTIINKIKTITQSSPFGLGIKTVNDPNVRKCSELSSKQFSFSFSEHDTNSCLSSKDNTHLETIRKSLAPHVESIVCEPYKLLLYEQDSFFLPHVDTPQSDNHFGSLIVFIPTETNYTGGDFLLTFNHKQIKWNPNKTDPNHSAFIAFYSDIEHEIKPVITGYRVVITLNILIPNHIKDQQFEEAMQENSMRNSSNPYAFPSDKLYLTPTGSEALNPHYSRSPFIDGVFESLSTCVYCKHIPDTILWIIIDFNGDHPVIGTIQTLLNDDAFHSDNVFENGVCLIFGHRYHGKYINPLTLKGKDMHLYRLFKQYCGSFLIPMTIASVIGKWSDDYDDPEEAAAVDYQGRIMEEWMEDNERTEWCVTLGAGWWIPTVLRSRFTQRQSSFVVLYSNKEQTLSRARYMNNGEEMYGNVGTYNIENQYHCTGLLLTKYQKTNHNM